MLSTELICLSELDVCRRCRGRIPAPSVDGEGVVRTVEKERCVFGGKWNSVSPHHLSLE